MGYCIICIILYGTGTGTIRCVPAEYKNVILLFH
jgi:hypothetical protein